MRLSGLLTCRAAVALALVLLGFSPRASLASDATVKIAGQSVFTVPIGTGQISAQGRAEIVQKNLDNALVAAKNRTPESVKIVYVQGLPVITLDGFKISIIDGSTAKAGGTTPAALANRWAEGIRKSLADSVSVGDYIAQLTGATAGATSAADPVATPAACSTPANPQAISMPASPSASTPLPEQLPMQQARVLFIPAGMVIPVTLTTGISSEIAQAGDRVEATVNQAVNLENGTIPAGSVVVGQVVESEAGKRMGHAGELNFKFLALRTPDGAEAPITAHLIGNVSTYASVGGATGDTVKGETTKDKVETTAIRGAVGAGAGLLLGTAIGAIASHGYGVGRGALSGAVIGGGLGVADALLLRKGANVVLKSGDCLQLQLDAPAKVALTNTGNL